MSAPRTINDQLQLIHQLNDEKELQKEGMKRVFFAEDNKYELNDMIISSAMMAQNKSSEEMRQRGAKEEYRKQVEKEELRRRQHELEADGHKHEEHTCDAPP